MAAKCGWGGAGWRRGLRDGEGGEGARVTCQGLHFPASALLVNITQFLFLSNLSLVRKVNL